MPVSIYVCLYFLYHFFFCVGFFFLLLLLRFSSQQWAFVRLHEMTMTFLFFPLFFLRHLFFFSVCCFTSFFFLLLLFTNLFFFFFWVWCVSLCYPLHPSPSLFSLRTSFTLRHLYLRSFNRKEKKRGWEKWTRSKPTVTVQKGTMEEVCQGLHLYNQEKENELSTRGV